MSGRLLRAIFDTRLIAVGLIVLQLGLSTGGHMLHAWMHALQDNNCASCSAHSVATRALSTESQALSTESRTTNCCSSRHSLASDSQWDNCCGDQLPPGDSKEKIPLGQLLKSDPSGGRCWSLDCAFYRGVHQTSTLTEQPVAHSLDQLRESLAVPTEATAVPGISFSLRARGPPAA